MGCAKRGIPETGFVGEEKSALYLCVCVASVYLPRVFSLYAPGAGMTEKLAKLRSNPEGSELNISSEGDMIKLSMKGRSSCVMPFFATKTSLSIGRSSLVSGGGGYLLTYSLFLVVVGVAKVFFSCWGRSIVVVAYAYSFCQG